MKNLFAVLFLIVAVCSGCSSDDKDDNDGPQKELQTTLYDVNKEAVAYIDYEDDATIYTFEGTPVAYIELKEQVYGFNGEFLGWYYNGVLYDNSSYAVGAKHGIARGGINTVVTHVEGVKGVQGLKPLKSVKGDASFVRPVLKDSWSETTLSDFLNSGIE